MSCPCSMLGVIVGIFQALFNSLARMSVRALRWATWATWAGTALIMVFEGADTGGILEEVRTVECLQALCSGEAWCQSSRHSLPLAIAVPPRPCSMGSSERMASIIFGQGAISCLGAGGSHTRGSALHQRCIVPDSAACPPCCLGSPCTSHSQPRPQTRGLPAPGAVVHVPGRKVGTAPLVCTYPLDSCPPPTNTHPHPAGIMCAATGRFVVPSQPPVLGALLAGGFLGYLYQLALTAGLQRARAAPAVAMSYLR